MGTEMTSVASVSMSSIPSIEEKEESNGLHTVSSMEETIMNSINLSVIKNKRIRSPDEGDNDDHDRGRKIHVHFKEDVVRDDNDRGTEENDDAFNVGHVDL